MWNITSFKYVVFLFYIIYGATGVSNMLCPGSRVPIEKAEVYHQVTPKGNTSAGRFVKVRDTHKLEGCVLECCKTGFCHVVFMYESTCFLIQCVSDELCQPTRRKGKKFRNAYMVQVRSASLSSAPDGLDVDNSQMNNLYDEDEDADMRPLLRAEKFLEYFNEDPMESVTASEESRFHQMVTTAKLSTRSKPCEVGIVTDCPKFEDCIPKNSRSRQGMCVCQPEYVRHNETERCVKVTSNLTTTSTDNTSAIAKITSPTIPAVAVTTPAVPHVKHLIVSAGDNKILQLPKNEVTLSAFALPNRPEVQYHYEWTLVSHPEGDDAGTMGDKNSQTLKLTSLKEGLYTLKVSVTGGGENGEALVNVTVLPPKRINKAPVAVINPTNQTVQMPNTDTVLDGSASTDDDKIVTYHWEQMSAPINYQPHLTDTATLQLTNLVPGFYQFMLTVTDSDGATNSAYANISVVKETDYPPTANAGPDVIIYLPQNEVVLNGNKSIDDKGIKSWEWTKGPDTDKAVDMQNTRTPYLRLSNLEIGMYTFILKVTDALDQSATAEVRVFVKPENNEVPVANAGANQDIVLPQERVVLDGTKSHDDLEIKTWEWKQLKGPNEAKLDTPNQSKTNASGLTKGIYIFQLTVTDEKKASNSSSVTVTVKQNENQPPKANAGGDKTIQLPVAVVILNGSLSSDDLGIESYKWTRQPASLAAGVILENSDQTRVLKLTNLIPGRYLFQLKVTDSQGAVGTDTASIIVKSDPHENDDVEMHIDANIYWFTEEQKVTLEKKLALLLHDEGEVQVNIESISSIHDSGRVVLIFNVKKITSSKDANIMPGVEIVYSLKRKLQTDSSLLDYSVLSLDTLVCQNNCSGHGTCDPSSKRCNCESFWMEDIFRYNFRDKESNCDWSILYVIIVTFTIIVGISGVIWAVICLCKRLRFRRPRKRHRYTLLKNGVDKEALSLVPRGKDQTSSLMISDSELESDTVFEQQNINGKLNGHSVKRQSRPNGVVHSRKIRT